MDRQIDPLLPDLGSFRTHWRLSHRLTSCVFFGLLVTGLSLLPSLSIAASSTSGWPVEKLRAVVIGTTFIIGLIMALVGEFCLIKPKPAPDRHIPATTAPPSLVGDS